MLLPSINFIACGSAIISLGAKPIFCDVESDTMNVDVSSLKKALTPKTRAAIVIHYGGHPCNIDELMNALDGIPLIEDSACSILSTYNGKNCGTFGTFGCFSFDSMKILCVGDGVLTDIAGASAESFDSLFVTGGLAASITKTDNHPKPEALRAYLQDEIAKPTYSIGKLR